MFRLALLVLSVLVNAAQAWEEPARGTELRRDLLDTVRVVAALDLSAPIEFVVREVRHDSGVAFASLQPTISNWEPLIK